MTRSRLVVSWSVVVVAVGLLVAASVFFLAPARAAVGPLPAEGLALPPDTRFVVGFDVKRLTASPFYAKYGKTHARPDAFEQLEEKTGIQPERDLDRVVIAGRGGDAGLALVQGRFDRTLLSRRIETEGRAGVTWKSHAGTTLYLFGEGSKSGGAFAFLSDDTLVVGRQGAIEATLDNHQQGRDALRGNLGLMALLEKVKPGSTFWMVGDQSLLAQLPRAIPAPGGAAGGGGSVSLPALQSLLVTGDVDPLIAVDVVGEAGDEAGARNLADVVRGFVALISLQAGQKPELKDLASAFSVTTEATRVHLNARIPYELIDALQPKRPGAAAARPTPSR